MKEAIWRALAVYYDVPQHWTNLVYHALDTDVSWDHSAGIYMDLYHNLGVW